MLCNQSHFKILPLKVGFFNTSWWHHYGFRDSNVGPLICSDWNIPTTMWWIVMEWKYSLTKLLMFDLACAKLLYIVYLYLYIVTLFLFNSLICNSSTGWDIQLQQTCSLLCYIVIWAECHALLTVKHLTSTEKNWMERMEHQPQKA